MNIKRYGSQTPEPGQADTFTGGVWIAPLFQGDTPSGHLSASVTFEPGARTAWHTHPNGQLLVVTAGSGWAQRDGGPIETIEEGDVIWFAAGEKHWHGASATTSMTHVAVVERLEGKSADWMEKVSNEQYSALEPVNG